jgi:hypothetical protein
VLEPASDADSRWRLRPLKSSGLALLEILGRNERSIELHSCPMTARRVLTVCLKEGISHNSPWQSAGMAAVFDQHLAIDDCVFYSVCKLTHARSSGREVLNTLFR